MYEFLINDNEINGLTGVINEIYHLDLNGHSVSAFKHRIGESLRLHGIPSIEELILRIRRDENFFQVFLKEIAMIETEAFRDSYIWRIIRFDILKDLHEKVKEKIKIWVPGCTTGDELYTLAIILKESCLHDKVEVLASSISEKCIEQIKSGIFNPKKIEVNIANYQRYKGKCDFNEYFTTTATKTMWDTSLIENVKFLKPYSLFNDPPQKVNLIIFRNRMLYYNISLQQKAFDILYNSLAPDGFLILGAKETILNFQIKHKFTTVNECESIYKKKTVFGSN